MSRFSRLARIAATAVIATGVFVGSAAPADAATDAAPNIQMTVSDTGWG